MFDGDHKTNRPTEPSKSLSGHVDDWVELAVDFVDGRLDPQTTAAIERHLDECPACAGRLRTQETVAGLLHAFPQEDPPFRLEDQVLDEVFAATRPTYASSHDRTQEPSRWSLVWRRRLRPWIPATIGVAAVFLAIIGYGLLRPGGSDLAREAAIPASYSEARTMTDGEEAAAELPAGTPAIPTTAAPMTTTAAAEVTTTTAETDIPAEPPENTTAVAMMAAGTQDRGAMIVNLEEAAAPAYFVFDAAALADEDSALKSAASVAEQIVALTGLQPLHDPLALDGPTFAAFVPRNDAAQLVDLLRSIGASAQIPVFMDVRPPDAAAEATTRLFAHKGDLPTLSARRIQPGVAGWTYTTSTMAKSGEGTADTGQVLPDEAGTHVLVVIYIHS